eukprot:CAMPEP_0176431026 /NCGR_PEP_ID=MMETSP0127-20121128/14582_1 /TAXON_ID=938130 /ORGANISM="Platyophrya macrostoma, Strain WH" /LENGTH=92 /DNA_ID=CAMNT_0017812985 /DNA_START=62 /DNA_END=340 /DNA_ORIENTATION=+
MIPPNSTKYQGKTSILKPDACVPKECMKRQPSVPPRHKRQSGVIIQLMHVDEGLVPSSFLVFLPFDESGRFNSATTVVLLGSARDASWLQPQ